MYRVFSPRRVAFTMAKDSHPAPSIPEDGALNRYYLPDQEDL
jgi:hypothetical protein